MTGFIYQIVLVALCLLSLVGQTRAFDAAKARFFKEIHAHYQLSTEQIECLNKQGFTVITEPSKRFDSFGDAFLDIYRSDLPVFITTDAILHAGHRYLDELLKSTEAYYLREKIRRLLITAHQGLDSLSAPDFVLDDLDLYFSVALNISSTTEDKYQPRRLTFLEVDTFIKSLFDSFGLKQIELFGELRTVDTSQFIVRGHYSGTPQLEHYFKLMMWLSREDLGFNLFKRNILPAIENNQLVPAEYTAFHRQTMVAVAFMHLLQKANVWDEFQDTFTFFTKLVGPTDSPSLAALDTVCHALNISDVSQLTSLPVYVNFVNFCMNDDFMKQRINSSFKYYNEPAKISLQPFSQRFTFDSYVMSQVVYGAIPQPRLMPSPLDVMFVLGNNTAKTFLAEELSRYEYEGRLDSLRQAADSLQNDFWNANVYHQWLNTIRSLSTNPGSNSQNHIPAFMRMKSWSKEKLNTQLASWAELRHDLILYVRQSYTMVICSYPYSYVEPYVEFYRQFINLYLQIEAAFQTLDDIPIRINIAEKIEIMQTLQEIARKELAHEQLTAEEKQFLDQVIDLKEVHDCTYPTMSGWYPQLFFDPWEAVESDYVISDVHTDLNSSQVLEVGTGEIELGIFLVDTPEDTIACVGPLSTFYEFEMGLANRMTDFQWSEWIDSASNIARAAWTQVYLTEGDSQEEAHLTGIPTSNRPKLLDKLNHPVLFPNHPNPFNPQTTLTFFLPQQAEVQLVIYDLLGRYVKDVIQRQVLSSGQHNAIWDGKDQAGTSVANGVYLCTLRTGNFQSVQRLMLVK